MAQAEPTRYLITGGAGFIGSHLVEKLVGRGDSVVVLDNLSTGSRDNLTAVSGVRFVQGSVMDPLVVDELTHEVDVVVHLAAAVGVELVVHKPLRSFLTNIRGTEVVLEAAHRYRTKVLLASTSEIYGKGVKVPFSEDDDRVIGSTKVTRWAYSTAKSVDEILGFAYHRERGLPTIVARLFNTVGPRQTPSYGMVLPRFVQAAISGKPLLVHGDGTQTRCFAHVADVVDAIVALLDEPRAIGDMFNVGSTEEVTILELAKRVIERAGSDSAIEFVPYDRAYEEGFEDMQRRVPDISKIGALVSWRPKHGLDRIIDDVIAETAKKP